MARAHLNSWVAAATVIQSSVRAWLMRRRLYEMLAEHRAAAVALQSCWRGRCARGQQQQQQKAAVLIQVRGWRATRCVGNLQKPCPSGGCPRATAVCLWSCSPVASVTSATEHAWRAGLTPCADIHCHLHACSTAGGSRLPGVRHSSSRQHWLFRSVGRHTSSARLMHGWQPSLTGVLRHARPSSRLGKCRGLATMSMTALMTLRGTLPITFYNCITLRCGRCWNHGSTTSALVIRLQLAPCTVYRHERLLAATNLQATWRMVLARRRFLAATAAAVKVQTAWRAHQQQRRWVSNNDWSEVYRRLAWRIQWYFERPQYKQHMYGTLPCALQTIRSSP